MASPTPITFTTGSLPRTKPEKTATVKTRVALGVPTNMLATRLRELEAAGVLSRLPLRHNTRAYALTDRGLALRDAIEALARWGGQGS